MWKCRSATSLGYYKSPAYMYIGTKSLRQKESLLHTFHRGKRIIVYSYAYDKTYCIADVLYYLELVTSILINSSDRFLFIRPHIHLTFYSPPPAQVFILTYAYHVCVSDKIKRVLLMKGL